ncbi:MAG: Uma2 family endonuclease [Pelatocladus maniniholoensis HA4357-MV3]|jgi:Uma2 family endonuclease|uniref:Uma2 family endonuclease n=1 Tax=Pelatocladus maniniholoensis HA4357-MV3 TaxID=1117104 RepID=A0A9E3H9C2_9NOST|nr:Uma2 family endonuclease [Pelatocladus maniniholoensis HA4357-MV3]
MTQALPRFVTFEEFVEWKPDGECYELHDGVIVKMPQPLGGHEEVTGFLSIHLGVQCYQSELPYLIPKTALVKSQQSESAYSPDVLIVNQAQLQNEPLWERESTVIYGASIALVVEVVSTNWRDDYFTKLGKYEEIGISEYWIVDYLALGGKRFIGNPKQPTISVYSLVEGEYIVTQFKNSDRIVSPTFPDFKLTAEQIFLAGKGGK